MHDFRKAVRGLLQGLWNKLTAWAGSASLTFCATPPTFPSRALREIEAAFPDARKPPTHPPLTEKERELNNRLAKETEIWNLNNVTRTQAYWNLYREYPELHWAMLAHMVSRNGGWSMTDLQGQWLPHLLDDEERRHHFGLLEACNALIFRDAYPQLKLYAESRRCGAPLFGLLPAFGVSSFMRPFWERFWTTRESAALTVALIVNEQHVIQRPIVEDPFYRSTVFEGLAFRSAPFLQTNQIVFPLLDRRGGGRLGRLRLAGRVLERFDSLDERIRFGKCLYGVLFGYPRILEGATAFADRFPHTGSRADYWPDVFRPRRTKTGGAPRVRGDSAGYSWYSPPLDAAWPDRPAPDARLADWFVSREALRYVTPPRLPWVVDMTGEHLLGQRKLQAACALVPQD